MPDFQHWRTSRRIVERIVIEGELELLSPTHLGGGNGDVDTTDMVLLRDAVSEQPILLGSSVAGALREYWRQRTGGYPAPPESGLWLRETLEAALPTDLFGVERGKAGDEDGEQSLLIIDDAISSNAQLTVRTGVSIDPVTRTAAQGKLFDIEVIDAGARFPLHMELVITEKPRIGMTWRAYDALPENQRAARIRERRDQLCQDLELSLQGFTKGEIGIGMRKNRGLGRCCVRTWAVRRYDMTTGLGLVAWLTQGRAMAGDESTEDSTQVGASLAEKLGIQPHTIDRRQRLTLKATFSLDGAMLIRSGGSEADLGPDATHILGTVFDLEEDNTIGVAPLVPGTSLAGALRARAQRIANTLSPTDDIRVQQFIHAMFGVGPEEATAEPPEEQGATQAASHWASRFHIREASIQDAKSMVQNRIRIDRFTGGVMQGALFDEAPVLGSDAAQVTLSMEMQNPRAAEIGLLLLLLKDLWTGDLPLGGTTAIGRGRLRGISASLVLSTGDGQAPQEWMLHNEVAGLRVEGDREKMQAYVESLGTCLKGGACDDSKPRDQ